MIESITPHTRYTHTTHWILGNVDPAQNLAADTETPPSTPDTSRFLCLWVGFIFMPFCLSWQTGGSGLHPQHHCHHASSHQQQHHLIRITIQSASLWLLHHLICIIVILHHQHHCDHAPSHQQHHHLIIDTTQYDHCIISPESLGSLWSCIPSVTVRWQHGYGHRLCAGGRDDEWWWAGDVVTLVIVTVIRPSIRRDGDTADG